MLLFPVDIVAGGKGGDGSVGGGGSHLTDALAAAVARHENAFSVGAAVLAREGVAALVKLYKLRKRLVLRYEPDREKDAGNGYIRRFAAFFLLHP